MTTTVQTLPATATTGGHGAYPILDGDRLVGIVAPGRHPPGRLPDDQPLLDHAAPDVVTVRPDDSTQNVLRVMLDERIEHVPVVDDRKLVGICTRTDLLKIRRRHKDLEQRLRASGPVPWPHRAPARPDVG